MIKTLKRELEKLNLKGSKNKSKIPKTVQDTIPYINTFSDGIIESEKNYFSKSMTFTDINYAITKQEDQEAIFVRYCDILNFFDSSFHIQITINNKKINERQFKNSIRVTLNNDELDVYREEYNNMIQQQITEGRNNIEKQMYITIGTKAKDILEARVKFAKMETEIKTNFKRIGSKVSPQTLKERLEILHDIFRTGEEGKFNFDENILIKQGVSTKSVIAPDSFEFKKDHFMIGNKYCRALFLRDLPSYLSDKFLNNLMELDKNLITSLHIVPLEQDKALRMIKRQITGMQTNKIECQKRSLKNGYLEAFVPFDLENSLNEAKELLDDVTNKNQKMFLLSLCIVQMADSKEELDTDKELLESIARKYVCQLGVLNYQQETGLKSVLPLAINRLKVDRALTTESTAVFIPFASEELLQKGGNYYGKNAVSRNLIMFDRKTLKTPNGFILGTPGSGKSFSAKREIIGNLLINPDDDIIVIDPEREYSNLAEHFGGQVIHISAASKNFINPLDMNENYGDEDEPPLLLKSEFILSLCECLIGGKEGLTAGEKTIIDRCLKKTYAEYLNSGFCRDKVPTLLDFQKVLESQPEVEAKELALAFEIYSKGSLSIFANKTNVDVDKRFVIYDIKDLGKQLKTMGLLIVLDAVWNRITANRAKGKRTWFYVDEIYLLFGNEFSAQFLFELYKRARKWGAIPTGITQNVEDLLQSDLARKMLSNSDFLLMLNQAPTDRAELAHLLNISDTQLSYITNANEGEGLLFNSNAIIPFIDQFPKNTELYKMMTTKVEEVEKVKNREIENEYRNKN